MDLLSTSSCCSVTGCPQILAFLLMLGALGLMTNQRDQLWAIRTVDSTDFLVVSAVNLGLRSSNPDQGYPIKFFQHVPTIAVNELTDHHYQ